MKDIYIVLEELNIPYERYDHPAVFTVAEAEKAANVPGKQCKNLFLTNDKGTKHFLATIPHDKRIDLKALGVLIGQKGLRFASPERLMKYLSLMPGSVSPLGLVNDANHDVEFLLDREQEQEEKIYIHPNINTTTLGIKMEDFKRLLNGLGHTIQVIEM
jgi:Ala-tRNA(Pro) deacylase